MNTRASYSYDPDIGLPIDDLRGGITLVDDACHVKVWKDSITKQITVCIVPKNGKVTDVNVLHIQNPGGGRYPGHYTTVKPTATPQQKIKNGKPVHCHEWQHPAVADRTPSNWCGICKDWFVPSRFD